MSYWRNPTGQTMTAQLFGKGNVPAHVTIEGGKVGFVPDEFDHAIKQPTGCGECPVWVKVDGPEDEPVRAAEPTKGDETKSGDKGDTKPKGK